MSTYRRFWLTDLAALIALTAATTALFQLTDLDLAVARRFYRPGAAEPWPLADRPLWQAAYHSAPVVTAALVLAAVGAGIAGTLRPARRRLRLHGLFLLLSVALGPGLIVNLVLKDHWDRPRPRNVVEFGGTHEYAPPPPLPGRAPGKKSFPCGHCSVGYLVAAGWFVWRRRRPAIGAACLLAGLFLGTALGIGRLAAGAHFLSDLLWSACISLGVAWALYYFVLAIPGREEALDRAAAVVPEPAAKRRLGSALALGGFGLLGAIVLFGGLLAHPFQKELRWCVERGTHPEPPRVVELLLGRADVALTLVDRPDPLVRLEGSVLGFGLPTNRLRELSEYRREPVPTVRYRLVEQGWYTDLDAAVRIVIARRDLDRIFLRVSRGDVVVREEGRGEPGDRPVLDVTSERGRVELPLRDLPPAADAGHGAPNPP